MVKRNRPATSEPDDEEDFEQPMKQLKGNRNGSPFSSTPHANYAPFFEDPFTSTEVPQNQTDITVVEHNQTDIPVVEHNQTDIPVVEHNQTDIPVVEHNQTDIPVVEQNQGFESFMKSKSLVEVDDWEELVETRRCKNGTTHMTIINDTTRSCIPTFNASVQNIPAEISHNEPKVLRVPYKSLEVISAQHPTTLTLHGYLKMTVLVGTVSVQGYDVTRNKSVYIFSSKKSGYKMVTTKSSVVRIPRKLKHTLADIALKESDEKIEEFVSNIGSFTSVFILQKTVLPPALQFLQLYFPNAVEMDLPKRKARGSDMFSRMGSNVIEVRPEAELIARELTEELQRSASEGVVTEELHRSAGPRVLVHGAKDSGKSTLLRYLIHKVLNTGTDVLYLDTDPGQTEFAPPGTVSLTKVTKPILSPPYCHQGHPLKMIFTGSSTAGVNPPYHVQCVRQLLGFYDDNFRNAVLFVNTMGWVEGAGDTIYKAIKALVQPTVLIDFLSEERPDVPIEKDCKHVKFPVKKYQNQSFSSKELREFALTAYLGKGQKYYMRPMFLNAFKPVSVQWKNVAIAVMHQRMGCSRLIAAINGSFVALCHVEDTEILVSVDPELPSTLKDAPVNECIGYGFVRAIDETKRLLYINTPLGLEKLEKVNAIVKGNIRTPDEFFLKQPVLNTPLPYTMESNDPPPFINKSVKKRTFIPQQTPKA